MPTFTLVAGPNGSGKSTITRLGREAFQDSPVLDPDAIAHSMALTKIGTASNFNAGREVLHSAENCISAGQDFLVETTLSGKSYLRMIAHAKEKGYFVVLIYVCTLDVSINMKRIEYRVSQGGHDVPKEDQIRRFPRSLAHFKFAFALADEAVVFDNSAESPVRVAVKDGEGVTLFEPLPEWAYFLRDQASGRG